jgi:hypothetical protein
VATVDTDGLVTGTGPGEATLTGSFAGLSDTALLAVEGLPVGIDVQPGDDANEIPPATQASVPVAILGTDEFDPTTAVDVSTLRFGAGETVLAGGGSTAFATDVGDVNGDGIDDPVVAFRVARTGSERGDTDTRLEGGTTDGRSSTGPIRCRCPRPRGNRNPVRTGRPGRARGADAPVGRTVERSGACTLSR